MDPRRVDIAAMKTLDRALCVLGIALGVAFLARSGGSANAVGDRDPKPFSVLVWDAWSRDFTWTVPEGRRLLIRDITSWPFQNDFVQLGPVGFSISADHEVKAYVPPRPVDISGVYVAIDEHFLSGVVVEGGQQLVIAGGRVNGPVAITICGTLE